MRGSRAKLNLVGRARAILSPGHLLIQGKLRPLTVPLQFKKTIIQRRRLLRHQHHTKQHHRDHRRFHGLRHRAHRRQQHRRKSYRQQKTLCRFSRSKSKCRWRPMAGNLKDIVGLAILSPRHTVHRMVTCRRDLSSRRCMVLFRSSLHRRDHRLQYPQQNQRHQLVCRSPGRMAPVQQWE